MQKIEISTTSPLGAAQETVQELSKPIHTILLDASPILLNTPSISTLLANSHVLVTTQTVLSEIRAEEARNRLDTLYRPFLTIRHPRAESIKLVKEFARKTGDSGVLSGTDLEVLALAYDLECERNNGDWRLRNTPGQKKVNGSPPTRKLGSTLPDADVEHQNGKEQSLESMLAQTSLQGTEITYQSSTSQLNRDTIPASEMAAREDTPNTSQTLSAQSDALSVLDTAETVAEDISSDSEDGWITPSNIRKHQGKSETASNTTKTEVKTLQVATLTGDFAMQNVLLQMNLNLISTKTGKRVAHIKQTILRCHACFATTKDMSKQFCPRCGGPTLTRVTCTTNDKGEVKLHLKANHQWNTRGNIYSIPKPTSGSANQRWKGPQQGGGKGGWGKDLILAEDQKEYIKAMSSAKRNKDRDLMDEDLVPSILTGDRDRGGGRVKVGAGRNINSRKR